MSLRTIRRYCVDFCMNGNAAEVARCTSPECPLYPFRMGHGIGTRGDKAPRAAIKARCMDCSGTLPAVKACPFRDCQLYPYRTGKRPSGNYSESASKEFSTPNEAVSGTSKVKNGSKYHSGGQRP